MGILSDIGLYLWRLLPGNPMVVRVVAAGGRRTRHLWARLAYLGVLFFAMLLFNSAIFGATGESLANLAKNATQIFMIISIVQLALMSFIAPVFAAGAITQEKDTNTFDILLTTPLTNMQIVLGSLFSRLFFVWVLLLAGVPIFCITMIYGGVTTREVFVSVGLAAATGLVTGAAAISISMLKVGTRRTVFAFFLGIAMYLLIVGAIGIKWSGTYVPEAPANSSSYLMFDEVRMSYLAPFHPFLALFTVTGQLPAPSPEEVRHYGWPVSFLLAYPHYGYIAVTTFASFLMIVASLIFVRRGAKEGENTIFNRIGSVFKRKQQGERTRKPRRVWRNPIAWREANTRGSIASNQIMRWAFVAIGLVLGVFALMAMHNGWFGLHNKNGGINDGKILSLLIATTWIELIIILLVVTNTAAGTLTREKESQTVEILLTTPLTSKYIVGGMLQGLVRFALPLIAVPAGTLLVFVIGQYGVAHRQIVPWDAVFLVPIMFVAFCAMAAVIGLQFSLNAKTTVRAVMVSVTIVLGGAGVLTACGFGIGSAGEMPAAIIAPFTPVPAIQLILDPASVLNNSSFSGRSAGVGTIEAVRLVTSLIASAAYLGLTFMLYKGMVKSFDMIVRRQAS